LETLKNNNSQNLQDLFVLAANQGRREQWYLEVGSAEPFYNNNTALLETQFDWRGVSVDINAAKVQDFANQRRNKVLCQDATQINYADLLADLGAPRDLGYLQVDCEPPETSYAILKRMPWDQYRFAAITFEHDYYADTSVRERSREFLRAQGYELMAGDIAFDETHSFEDWWVHPDLVSIEVRARLRDSADRVKPAQRYLFPH
jgi:hypothetical protein